MAELDQAARYALKLDPAAALDWLLPDRDRDLAFARWLDTETVAFPGEPGRRCDTVAELLSRSGTTPPWAMVLEVEAAPKRAIAARSLEYVARLMRKLRHGPHGRDAYQFAAAVLFLSGGRRDVSASSVVPGTEVGLRWAPRVKCVPLDSAAQTLEKIARGELGRSILAWVPLMDGGGEAATIAEWLRLAGEEPSTERRGEYAALALVFAERAGCLPVWKQPLEGWNVVASKLVAEWRAEARAEGRTEGRAEAGRLMLLTYLREKFSAEPPPEVEQLIADQADPAVLSRWLIEASRAASLAAFREAIQAATPPEKPNGTPAGS